MKAQLYKLIASDSISKHTDTTFNFHTSIFTLSILLNVMEESQNMNFIFSRPKLVRFRGSKVRETVVCKALLLQEFSWRIFESDHALKHMSHPIRLMKGTCCGKQATSQGLTSSRPENLKPQLLPYLLLERGYAHLISKVL